LNFFVHRGNVKKVKQNHPSKVSQKNHPEVIQGFSPFCAPNNPQGKVEEKRENFARFYKRSIRAFGESGWRSVHLGGKCPFFNGGPAIGMPRDRADPLQTEDHPNGRLLQRTGER
jgi:hypothetical protein